MSEEDKELNAKKEQARIDATRRRSSISQEPFAKKKVESTDKEGEVAARGEDVDFLKNLIFGED